MNNKGNFKEDGSVGNKFKAFFKESGFYIAIVVGLCALAAGAVFFSTNQILSDPDQYEAEIDPNDNLGIIDYSDPIDDTPDDQSYIVDNGSLYSEEGPYVGIGEEEQASEGEPKTADAEVVETKPDTVANKPQEAANDAKPVSGNTQANIDDNSATEDVVLAVVRPAFKAPVNGTVQAEYSMDKLVFSPTFNEWRTHSGVDIAAPRGEVVRSVGNGVVSEIKNDPRFGFTVVIDHKNGYKSVYSNLASDQTIQVGQEVKQGDPIGSVGATAIFESAEATHLHFELYKEDKLVDPAEYIDLGVTKE